MGKSSVGGMDISKIDPEKLMTLYSIVFQDVTLFNNTIMENIRLGRKGATDEEVLAAAHLAKTVMNLPKNSPINGILISAKTGANCRAAKDSEFQSPEHF